MEPRVSVNSVSSSASPQVVVTNGVDFLQFPWPVWEMLVHRASAAYVRWALSHPQEYSCLETHMASGAGRELIRARRNALLG